jgi:hypothetical protein
MDMDKLDQSLAIMSFAQHLLPSLMNARNLRIPKIQDRKRPTVHREHRPHAQNVSIKMSCPLGIRDAETDVVQFPAYCLRGL